jgi:hypothetical protein
LDGLTNKLRARALASRDTLSGAVGLCCVPKGTHAGIRPGPFCRALSRGLGSQERPVLELGKRVPELLLGVITIGLYQG